MKKLIKFLFPVVVCLFLVACGHVKEEVALWDEAVYLEDMTFGEGEKMVLVEVKAEDKSVTFTINTDKEILGDALLEHELIDGEEGPYGLYIKKVNGMTADYNINQSYWAFEKGGESMATGVDGAEISDGEHYELIYIKQ